jgi:hypothetical protein
MGAWRQCARVIFSAAVGRRSASPDWERTRSCFEQAREREEMPEVLDGLSEVAHFAGEYERAIELKERAFAAYRHDGKRAQAADVARWLALRGGRISRQAWCLMGRRR